MIAFSACSDIKMVLNVGLNDKAVTHVSAVCIKHDCFDSPRVFVYLLDAFVPMKSVKNNTMYWMSSTFVIFFSEDLCLLFLFWQIHSSGRNSEIPPRVRQPCLYHKLQRSGTGHGYLPWACPAWRGFEGWFLRLPRTSGSNNLVLALNFVKMWADK